MWCSSSAATFQDIREMQNYVQQERIPSKDLLHSGLFASHFFDINPDLDPITTVVTTKLFSSKFANPVNSCEERILVLGITGCEDGRSHRPTTDFVLVIDRSGSMRYRLTDTVGPGARRPPGQAVEALRQKMSLAIEAAELIFDLLANDQEVGILMFDEVVDVIEPMKAKSAVDRDDLFSRLAAIEPRGGTDFGLGLSAAISMLKQSSTATRNQRARRSAPRRTRFANSRKLPSAHPMGCSASRIAVLGCRSIWPPARS
jgi:hypothetical protein